MSDSPINSDDIPPCPFKLVEILDCLASARRDFVPEHVPGSKESDFVTLIQMAASQAYEDNEPLTKEYATEFIGKLRPICEEFRVLIDRMGVETFGEVVGQIKWLCQRINVLTGIPAYEIERTIARLVDGKTLDWQYGDTGGGLNHVAAKLRELDVEKTTEVIWGQLWRRFPFLQRAYRNAFPLRAENMSNDPADPARAEQAALGAAAEVEKPPLDGRQPLILQALLKLKAFDSDTKVKAKEIAGEIGTKEDQLKRDLAYLANETKFVIVVAKGPASGYWLTPEGWHRAEEL